MSRLDVYNSFLCYPIGRTYIAPWCGGGEEDILPWGEGGGGGGGSLPLCRMSGEDNPPSHTGSRPDLWQP